MLYYGMGAVVGRGSIVGSCVVQWEWYSDVGNGSVCVCVGLIQ